MFKQRNIQPKIAFLSNETEIAHELSSCVTAFQVRKDINQIAGTFELTLVPRPNWGSNVSSSKILPFIYKNISPMDLISIGVENRGGIMSGIVDNVYKDRSNINDQVRQTIKVRGRDFGKILVEDNTMFAPSSDTAYISKLKAKLLDLKIVNSAGELEEHPLVNFFTENRAPKWMDTQGGDIGRTFMGKSIKEALEFVLKSLTSLRVKLTFEGKENQVAHELLNYQVASRDGDKIATTSYNSYMGSIANLLLSIIDKDFYELFIETVNNQAVLIVRPKPYDRIGDMVTTVDGKLKELTKNDPFMWENLKTLATNTNFHEVGESDIIQSSLGVADYEAYSMYVQNARNTLLGTAYEQAGIFWPLIDTFALKRWGMRRKDTNTNLVPMEKTDDGSIKDQVEKECKIKGHRDRAFNWNRFNPLFESGNIVVRGHDYYKLGDKIFLPEEIAKNGERGITAYCSGYSHSWNFGGPYLTSLNLIRGENKELLKKYKKLTDKHILRSG